MKARTRLVTIAAAALIVVGCASSGAATQGAYQGYSPQGGANERQDAGALPAASAAASVGAAAAAASNAAAGDGSQNGTRNNAPKPEDYIVKTGLISIEVADLDGAIVRATDIMHSLGGYLAGSQRASDGKAGVASVTYRIPAAKFEDALAQARKLGNKVLSEHSESTPVGGQIVDLQARIDNLKTSEKAIQAIMARASAIPDVLTVEGRLSDVQGQIEQLSGQLASLTDQATYSTLTIELDLPAAVPTPTPTASPTTAAAWTVGHEFDQASGALASVAQGVATISIWIVVVFLPIAIGLFLLALLALLLLRLWRRVAPAIVREAGLGPVTPPEA